MKKLLTASLPALALLALGGCSATRSVATTEDDGVYYSSKDRTTAVVRTAPAEAAPVVADGDDEATNPDYQSADTRRQASNTPEYYDDSYSSSSYDGDSRFRQPYAGPTVGLAYYSPPVVFAPAIVSYGYGAGGYGYSPYGSSFYDPFYSSAYGSPYYQPYAFYDPFFSPYGYGYGGSYVNINIGFGFGRPWGGYGYGRPYYGYGAYAYDPYSYYGGYGRGYGNGGYGAYYGNRQVIRPNGTYAEATNPVLVGPRRGRGGDVLAGRGNVIATPESAPASTGGRGRRGGIVASPAAPIDGLTAPTTAPSSSAVGNGNYGRRRLSNDAAPNSPTAITDQPTTGRRTERLGSYETTAPTPPPSADANPDGRTRRRSRDLNDGTTPAGALPGSDAGRRYERPQQADVQPQPAEQRSTRRARVFESAPDNGQSQPARTYERPVEQPRRTYERPTQTERSYERPSQPSYSAPSSSGGNGGGGNGGGGRRGGRF